MGTSQSREAYKGSLISAENDSGQKELPMSRFKCEGIAAWLQHAKWTWSILVKDHCGLKCSNTETYFVETGLARVTPFQDGILSCEAIAVIYTMWK